jgi:hypothetical protein
VLEHLHAVLLAAGLQGLRGPEVLRCIAAALHTAVQHDRHLRSWGQHAADEGPLRAVEFAVALLGALYPSLQLSGHLPDDEADDLPAVQRGVDHSTAQDLGARSRAADSACLC